ncbi:MAG: hypothetical protein NT106_03275, partial [Candidatus Sumerlaeota bacterium]|nr:hypothetical protein [Candidatus Sumerlaeota bacterium]
GTPLASEPFPGSLAMKDVSGLAWRISADSDILSLMVRQRAAIFEVHDGAVINTIPIAENIAGGVSGLVYNEGAKEYWFLVPQRCELLILSLTGQLKKKLSLPAAYSKMAVDFETNTVYLSDSGCNQIDRYLKSENNLIHESPILLSHLSPLLCRSGVGALAWRQAEKNLAVCTTDHIYILIDARYDAHIVAGPASLSRGRNIVSLSTEKSTGCLFALDLDAVPAVISLDGKNHHASVFSLEDFLTQNSFFRPAAIAFDTRRNLGGEILVADRAESGFAVFDRNGKFISFQMWMTQGDNSPIGSSIKKPDMDENRGENSFIGQPITGMDIDENTGDILIRSRHGLIWTNRQGMNRCFSSVDGSDPGGVSAGADAIYTLAPNGRRIDRMKTDGRPGGSSFLVGLSSNDAPSGLASNPDRRLLYVSLATSGDTIIYNEEKITSADSSWNSYE